MATLCMRSVFIWWNKADLVSNQICLGLIIDLNTILFTCSVMVGLQLMTLLLGFLVLLLLLLSSLIGVPCHLRCRCFYTCFKIYLFFYIWHKVYLFLRLRASLTKFILLWSITFYCTEIYQVCFNNQDLLFIYFFFFMIKEWRGLRFTLGNNFKFFRLQNWGALCI